MHLFLTWLVWLSGPSPEIEKVTNPVQVGRYTLDLKEDLRFGAEEDGDEYLWVDGQISTRFDVDKRGHFYITDIKNSRILEFDEQGAFIGELAKKGEGPGEYQNLFLFEILTSGRAIGFDFLGGISKFSYYDDNLKYLETKSHQDPKFGFYLPDFSDDGRWVYAWGFSFNAETASTVFKTALFNNDFQMEKLLSETPWPTFDPNRFNDPEFWVDYLAQQFDGLINRGSFFARFLDNGDVLVANSKKYEIERYRSNLKTAETQIVKDYEPIPFAEKDVQAIADFVEETLFEQVPAVRDIATPNVIRRAVQKANLPKLQNPVADILPMEGGRFLVMHQANIGTGSFIADLFDEKGKCIGRVASPGNGIYDVFGIRARFKNGYFYAMEKNEDGDNQMVRYRFELVKR